MRCNCSLCTRNGYLNVYPLRNEIRVQLGSVEVAPGSAALRKEIDLGYYTPKGAGEGSEHVFCVKCGSSVWVDRLGGEEGKAVDGEEDFVALNVRLSIRAVLNEPSMQKVRMLKDIDVGELVFEFANGKSWEPQYQI
ncbi:hypothetical protein MMC19_001596 [Ptychographa xylographoides]|nr:hypothetical protein [Ptychographa xylographoides]